VAIPCGFEAVADLETALVWANWPRPIRANILFLTGLLNTFSSAWWAPMKRYMRFANSFDHNLIVPAARMLGERSSIMRFCYEIASLRHCATRGR
jgi:hypothetical protein